MTILRSGAATAAVVLFAHAGLAQERTAQFDVNNLSFQSRNGAGAPAAFGGVSHTGSLVFTDVLPTTELVAVLMRTGAGPFLAQPGGPWALSDASLTINLNNGMVTGGNLLIDIGGGPGGGGDRYSATLGAAGVVSPFVGGGFMVEGLSANGQFSDSSFGSVNVADFVASQGTPPFLTGWFLGFRIQPDAQGAGFADLDAFVTNVPAPGSFALLGVGMIFAARRRR
jgi:MYXO-CTERM domain-containing protein